MKRTLLALAALCVMITHHTTAQITITTSDLPTIGLQVIRAVDNTTQINPGNAGTNQVWDFSNLLSSSYDTILYLPPQGQPNHQNYPEAEVAIRHYNGNIQPYYDYEYARYDAQGMRYVGDEDLLTIFGDFTMAIHISCTPNPLGLRLPFNYGDNYTQNTTYVWHLASHNAGVLMDSIKQISHMEVTTTGDASGIVTTPYGSYQALRVKDDFVSQDSIFNWTPDGWVFDRAEVNSYSIFTWYTNDYYEVGKYTIDEEKGNSMSFFKSETIVGLQNIPVMQTLQVYPNPAENMITIPQGQAGEKIELFDMAGQLKLTGNNPVKLDVSSLPDGMYLIRLATKEGYLNGRFIKQ